MYESKREQAEIKATRADWTITAWADNGVWSVKVASEGGWGNAGSRDLYRHFDAAKARARRLIAKELRERGIDSPVRVDVTDTRSFGTGVMYSMTFTERVSREVAAARFEALKVQYDHQLMQCGDCEELTSVAIPEGAAEVEWACEGCGQLCREELAPASAHAA